MDQEVERGPEKYLGGFEDSQCLTLNHWIYKLTPDQGCWTCVLTQDEHCLILTGLRVQGSVQLLLLEWCKRKALFIDYLTI